MPLMLSKLSEVKAIFARFQQAKHKSIKQCNQVMNQQSIKSKLGQEIANEMEQYDSKQMLEAERIEPIVDGNQRYHY